MKRVLFLISHLGSDVEQLANVWQEHPRIQFYKLPIVYAYPTDLLTFTSVEHKHRTNAAIYLTCLMLNEEMSGRLLYKLACCKFIYLIRRPLPAITRTMQQYGYSHIAATNMYIMRLRRMYEMAVQTPGAIFLTWDNIKEKKGTELAEHYLHLKTPLPTASHNFTEPEECLPQSQVQEAEEVYEGIVYRMKKLQHLKLVSQ